MADPPPDDGGRKVLGRSRSAEPRRVTVDPSADAGGSAGADAPAPPRGPSPGGRPAPPAGPPAPAPPWSRPPQPAGAPAGRRVIGSSSAPGPSTPAGPVDGGAAPSARPVTGRGGGSGRPPDEPRPASAPAPSRPPRRTRRLRPRHVVAALVVLVVGVPLLLLGVGWWQYSKIPKVDVADALSARGGRAGTNYLVVGTDSREGIGADDPNAGAFLAEEVGGARTDTIMVLHTEGSTAQLLSIPRDLLVTDPTTGEVGRINATFASGPANLITAVTALGIPIDHYMEINFVSFAKLVDAVGGITIDVPFPARDEKSGLLVEEAGPQRLDGSQALAYVRSRTYTELKDGQWVTDPTADIGRTLRQRQFLTALMDELGAERNPFSLARIPGALGSGMRLDTTLGYLDALRFGWRMKGIDPEPLALPVTPRTTSGGAAVLDLQPSADAVIAGVAR